MAVTAVVSSSPRERFASWIHELTAPRGDHKAPCIAYVASKTSPRNVLGRFVIYNGALFVSLVGHLIFVVAADLLTRCRALCRETEKACSEMRLLEMRLKFNQCNRDSKKQSLQVILEHYFSFPFDHWNIRDDFSFLWYSEYWTMLRKFSNE